MAKKFYRTPSVPVGQKVVGADIFLEINGQERFSWGIKKSTTSIEVESSIRDSYVAALKLADKGSFDALLTFAKS